MKEATDNGRAGRLRVELADACNHHSPGHASRKTHYIGVDGPSLCPKLDGTQSMAKCLDLWHQCQYLIRDSGTIDAAQVGLIKATEKRIVLEIERHRYRGDEEPGKDQINADT